MAVVMLFASCSQTIRNEDSFNQALASELGADDYGMRTYTLGLLFAGPERSPDSTLGDRIMRGHLDHINLMAERGQLAVAGPLSGTSNMRGIFVFATDDTAQARKWLNDDPAVQAGLLYAELHLWYASAALMRVPTIHKQLELLRP
jgi:uncharacterized protein YciI